MPQRRTQSSTAARLPPLFLWKRERKRKEGPLLYHPTCRLMLHGCSQPTVVMAATCHVICVSPCINVDVWDRRPPAGNLHKAHGKCVSPAGSRGHTHGNLRCCLSCPRCETTSALSALFHHLGGDDISGGGGVAGNRPAPASIQRAFLHLGKDRLNSLSVLLCGG